jgi:hypothetical protein
MFGGGKYGHEKKRGLVFDGSYGFTGDPEWIDASSTTG